MKKRIISALLVALAACGPQDVSDPELPTASSALTSTNMTVNVAPTNEDFELRITWGDYPDEDFYQLYESDNANPGPVFASGSGGIGAELRPGWREVTQVPRNQTSYTDVSLFPTTYAVCAVDNEGGNDLIMECHFSARVAPRLPDPATIDALQITTVGTDRIGVSWQHSQNTVSSRISISPVGGSQSPIDDDSNQSVLFTGLSPNVNHTVTLCVQSRRDVETDEETCKTASARTFPLTPIGVRSLSVNHGDIVPTRRIVTFEHSNPQSSGVIGFSVRAIRDDQVVREKFVYPEGFGLASYDVVMDGLQPFTGYEFWVIPYNNNPQQPVGEAAGIGATTPAQVNVTVQPLSGKSAMLIMDPNAPGDLIVERKSGTSFIELGRVRVTDTNQRRVVIDNLAETQTLRVTWKLAFLTSRSSELPVVPAVAGTPEFYSMSNRSIGLQVLPSRLTAVLLPTVSSRTEYELQGRQFGSSTWQVLVSTPNPLILPLFTAGQPVTLSGDTSFWWQDFRVCQRQPPLKSGGLPVLKCSPNESFTSAGLPRFAMP